MPTITFNIPDTTVTDPNTEEQVTLVQALISAICANHGYDAEGGQTKGEFANAELRAWIRNEWQKYKTPVSVQAAYQSAADEAESETSAITVG